MPSSPQPFAVTYPIWGLAGPNSVVLDPDGTTARFVKGAVLHLVEVDGNKCCPVFTDDNLVQRYVQKYNLNGWRGIGLGSAAQLIMYLSAIKKAGFQYVAVDPGEAQSRYRDIDGAIADLGQYL
jgi:hypothetical protein